MRDRIVIVAGRFAMVVIALFACARPAKAQSGLFVGGDLFADLKRFSAATTNTPNALNGNALGGGAEVGVFLSPRWSLSLSVDVGAATSTSTPIPIGVLAGVVGDAAPITRFQSRVTNRITATSILVGYHAAVQPRVHLGALGGLAFLHATTRFDTISPVRLGAVPSALVVRPHTVVDNVPAVTVGGELAIDVVRRLAFVSFLHAHAFTLTNAGPSAFAIRPGVAARWTF